MSTVFKKPHALTDAPLHYCPGCTHGIIHRLVAEVIDELGIEGRTIGVAPVGCSVMAYNYFNCDMVEAAYGRDTKACGFPVKVCEMLSQLEGPEYLERVAVNNVKNIRGAKKAIKKAFQNQLDGKGFSLVEVISTCPTNWGMPPAKALEWVDEKMIPYYPLGVYKDRSAAQKEEA